MDMECYSAFSHSGLRYTSAPTRNTGEKKILTVLLPAWLPPVWIRKCILKIKCWQALIFYEQLIQKMTTRSLQALVMKPTPQSWWLSVFRYPNVWVIMAKIMSFFFMWMGYQTSVAMNISVKNLLPQFPPSLSTIFSISLITSSEGSCRISICQWCQNFPSNSTHTLTISSLPLKKSLFFPYPLFLWLYIGELFFSLLLPPPLSDYSKRGKKSEWLKFKFILYFLTS